MYKGNDYMYDALYALESNLKEDFIFQTNRPPYDAILEIGNDKFYCYAKKEARKENATSILAKIIEEREVNSNKNFLFIGDYIARDIKDVFRENNINYIDGAGNALIKTDQIFITIEGKKKENLKNFNQSRAFQESGLKLIMVFLTLKDSVNDSYRSLAEKAGIALGSVSQVMSELEESNFLLKTNDGRKLKNEKELLERWVIGFSEIIKPRYFKKSYNLISKTVDPRIKVAESICNTSWGGEVGGQIYTDYLVPEHYTLYIDGDIGAIARELKLIPALNGKFEIYQKFWSSSLDNDKGVAPPLVVYGDLKSSGFGRNNETAEIILKNGLQYR